MNEINISMETIRMFRRIMRPIAETGVIPLAEFNECISQLTSLAEHGTLKPVIVPKLIDQRSAAELLGVGLSNFKRLESEGAFSFKRKIVGSSVRYRNTDIIDYIYSTEEEFGD
ncbi:MAG: hypothetical protein IKM15_05265 [Peptococcaceae bacterium]|nr:hypothetical protein [Peptococcaceae bacterium]